MIRWTLASLMLGFFVFVGGLVLGWDVGLWWDVAWFGSDEGMRLGSVETWRRGIVGIMYCEKL